MFDDFRKSDLREQEFIGDYCVSTVALSIEHHGGKWYETYIFPADGEEITGWLEVWGERYATREEAVEGHARTCERMRAGELETWDGKPPTPTQAASQEAAPKPFPAPDADLTREGRA